MEYGFSMKHQWKKIFLILLLLCFLGEATARDVVVLVSSSKSPLDTLSSLELRKIYLGFNVFNRQGNSVKALVNANDKHLEHIFLQNVVAMSDKSYRHRLLSLMVRRGIPRPASFKSLHDLYRELLANPDSVSFMWIEDAEKLEGLKIIRVLWQKD
jgi:hypothetical protein